jgi:hypothetical protein
MTAPAAARSERGRSDPSCEDVSTFPTQQDATFAHKAHLGTVISSLCEWSSYASAVKLDAMYCRRKKEREEEKIYEWAGTMR